MECDCSSADTLLVEWVRAKPDNWKQNVTVIGFVSNRTDNHLVRQTTIEYDSPLL